MLSAAARQDIARAYGEGRMLKQIAHEHGISTNHVSAVARLEGQNSRRRVRRAVPRAVCEPEVLALFKQGLDTYSIAARLALKPCEAANALARARDRERSR
jgi:hypothetical protein